MFSRTCDVRHVGILFHFFINSARFRKKCFVFFSFVVRFRLVIRFYSHFFVLLVRCFPQHQVFQQKRLYSSCQAFLISSCNPILFYSGENRWFSCNLRRHKQQWWNEQMLVDKQSELMSDLLFTIHQHGGDDVTWKPPILLVAHGTLFFAVLQTSLR